MAKVIAPFKIVGTLDDLVFYVDQDNVNRVKTKGNTGITSKQFLENPIFTKARNHGKEFGRCTKWGQKFRKIAHYFYERAKDGSFSGRSNKLMLEIMNEDTTSPHGERTVDIGIEAADAKTYFTGFEGNKLRKLKNVLKTKWEWDEKTRTFLIKKFNPTKHIDWPEEAEQVHLAIAYANWNYKENKFHTEYSNEIIMEKDEKTANLLLQTELPEGDEIKLTFLYIGFSTKERKKFKELKRSNNTVTIIHSR